MDGRRLIQQYVQEIDASRPGDAVSSQLGAEFDEADCVVRVRWVEDDDPREGILVIRDGDWLLVSVSPPVEEAARTLELHLQPLGKIDDAAIVEDWGYRDEGGLVWNRLAALSLTHEKVPGGEFEVVLPWRSADTDEMRDSIYAATGRTPEDFPRIIR